MHIKKSKIIFFNWYLVFKSVPLFEYISCCIFLLKKVVLLPINQAYKTITKMYNFFIVQALKIIKFNHLFLIFFKYTSILMFIATIA